MSICASAQPGCRIAARLEGMLLADDPEPGHRQAYPAARVAPPPGRSWSTRPVSGSSTAQVQYHAEWRPGQGQIAAGGGAGRRPAEIADAPFNQSREAHDSARPLHSPEGGYAVPGPAPCSRQVAERHPGEPGAHRSRRPGCRSGRRRGSSRSRCARRASSVPGDAGCSSCTTTSTGRRPGAAAGPSLKRPSGRAGRAGHPPGTRRCAR